MFPSSVCSGLLPFPAIAAAAADATTNDKSTMLLQLIGNNQQQQPTPSAPQSMLLLLLIQFIILLRHSSASNAVPIPVIPSMAPSPTIIGSTPPAPASSPLRLSHHKVNPAVAALNQQQMDEWALYRMAFLLFMVISMVALWASYKLLCESDECGGHDEVVYQPLNSLLIGQGHGGMIQMHELDNDDGEEEEDDDLVLVGNEEEGNNGGGGQRQGNAGTTTQMTMIKSGGGSWQ